MANMGTEPGLVGRDVPRAPEDHDGVDVDVLQRPGPYQKSWNTSFIPIFSEFLKSQFFEILQVAHSISAPNKKKWVEMLFQMRF